MPTFDAGKFSDRTLSAMVEVDGEFSRQDRQHRKASDTFSVACQE